MSWSLSFKLLPGEEVVEDSSKDQSALIKPVYSIILTNQRVIFRFDGLGSLLKKSFSYDKVRDAKAVSRFKISYLLIESDEGEHLFNVSDPELWSKKILSARDNSVASSTG